MTDNEIIKALKCLIPDDNDKGTWLPFSDRDCVDCEIIILKNALDLINRQQAEIEMLQLEVEAVNDLINPFPFKSNFDKAIETAKSEAIKEFAERLKQTVCDGVRVYNGMCTDVGMLHNIDNLVKEMTDFEGESDTK